MSSRDDELEFVISFLDHCIIAGSNRPEFRLAMRNLFAMMVLPYQAQVERRSARRGYWRADRDVGEWPSDERDAFGIELFARFYRQVVALFIDAHPRLTWLHAGAVAAQSIGLSFCRANGPEGKARWSWNYAAAVGLSCPTISCPLDPSAATVMPFPARRRSASTLTRVCAVRTWAASRKSALALDPAKWQRPAAAGDDRVSLLWRSAQLAKLIPISGGQAVVKIAARIA